MSMSAFPHRFKERRSTLNTDSIILWTAVTGKIKRRKYTNSSISSLPFSLLCVLLLPRVPIMMDGPLMQSQENSSLLRLFWPALLSQQQEKQLIQIFTVKVNMQKTLQPYFHKVEPAQGSVQFKL